MTEREIFVAALHQPGAAERQAFLDRACGGDADLRGRVEALLAENDGLGSFLERPAVPPAQTATFESGGEAPGTRVGPYKLLEVIGEGGMGTVWMADQTEPIRRRVAVKVVKAGMDSQQVLARFEAERQALALMDHPNIARVLDAGTTGENPKSEARNPKSEGRPGSDFRAAGRPYFVMELVKGVPITKFCDDRHLSVEERLRIFQQVCHAVQHAHQKGVIHRDLKPSNVLVESHDGRPVPKVIDFGLAKAIGATALTDRSLFTNFGTVLGTPQYMAPEQAEFGALDVDTRADVYALGVILYELLTGTTPLEKQRLAEAGWDEIRRVIKEEEPQTPSARLSSSAGRASVAALRQTEPARLGRFVRGDLDWIVMKALAKERDRRYESASAFAADLERFLNQEPVAAGPPTAAYKLRRFVRRHRRAVLAAGTMAALLVAGTVGTAVGLVRALRAEQAEAEQRKEVEGQRDRALTAEGLATERLAEVTREKDRAAAAEARATGELEVAWAVNNFLRYDLLAQAAPENNPRAKKVTVEEVLGRAAAQIDGKFGTRPRMEGAVRLTIGDAYVSLGDFRAAQPHLERALDISRRELGEDHTNTYMAQGRLGALYLAQGQYAKSEPLLVRALDGRRRALGADHADTLASQRDLAGLYRAQGRYAQAGPLYDQALDGYRRVLGVDHPETLLTMNNLGSLYWDLHRFAQAEPLFVQALNGRRRALGNDHPATLTSVNNLASLYQDLDRPDQAEPLYREVVDGARRVLGPDHPATLTYMINLGTLYLAQKRYAEAEPLFVQASETRGRVLGEDHPATLATLDCLGALYREQGQLAKAEQYFRRGLAATRRVLGEDHPDTLTSLHNVGVVCRDLRQLPEAGEHLARALEGRRRVLGDDHPYTLATMSTLAAVCADMGQFDRTEALRRELLDRTRKRHGASSLPAAVALDRMGEFFLLRKDAAAAESVLRESLAIREKLQPDGWATFDTRSILGAALLRQKKLADAEPLLTAAYEGLRQRAAAIPARDPVLAHAADRLVELYTAWGKPAEAEKWRAERARYPTKPSPAAPPAKP